MVLVQKVVGWVLKGKTSTAESVRLVALGAFVVEKFKKIWYNIFKPHNLFIRTLEFLYQMLRPQESRFSCQDRLQSPLVVWMEEHGEYGRCGRSYSLSRYFSVARHLTASCNFRWRSAGSTKHNPINGCSKKFPCGGSPFGDSPQRFCWTWHFFDAKKWNGASKKLGYS